MKKLILTAIVAVFGLTMTQAQGFSAGLHVGAPMGDASDPYTLNVGADLMYLFNVAEGLDVGPAVGYTTFLGDEIDTGLGTVEVDNASFIPVAAVGRYTIAEMWFAQAGLGYAVGIEDGQEGGFMYQPEFGVKLNQIDISAFYRGVSISTEVALPTGETAEADASFGSIGVKFGYRF